MNLRHEIRVLLSTGQRFSNESEGRDVLARLDSLPQYALTEIVGTLDDALEWLRRQRDAVMA